MKKKILSMLLISAMTLSLVACGGSKDSNDTAEDKGEEEVKEEVKDPVDLTGTWKSENNDGAWMEATIAEDTISINWVSDNGETKSIYWIGTYTAPTEYVEEYTWVSDRDKEQTDTALLASTDDTKEFTYSNETISYEASAMGTTTTVKLEKEE